MARQTTQRLKARHIPAASINARQPSLKLNRPALDLLQNWATELTTVRILDPACGSGNFLYLALKRLLDLWHKARVFGIEHGLTLALEPIPAPSQLFGIEIDFYAHEIAIRRRLDRLPPMEARPRLPRTPEPHSSKSSPTSNTPTPSSATTNDGKPYEPEWPEADYIIGNPPFLGGNRDKAMNWATSMSKTCLNSIQGRIPHVLRSWLPIGSRKLAMQIATGSHRRAGLLATQAIRGGANRTVIERGFSRSGGIFYAWRDRKWVLDGAAYTFRWSLSTTGKEKTRSP